MYLIFGGEEYYGSGGANDLLCNSTDKDHAIAKAKQLIGGKVLINLLPMFDGDDDLEREKPLEWVHVYCLTNNSIIYKSETKPYGDLDFEKEGISSIEIMPL